MRRGERPFSVTRYARMSEGLAAKHMLACGYRQVSRRFGDVSRVDVPDEELLVRIGRYIGSSVPEPVGMDGWRDYYRRCVSEDVITDVPEPVMFRIRNPDKEYRPPGPNDEEFVAMIIELGLV